jgi:hypothetical protein
VNGAQLADGFVEYEQKVRDVISALDRFSNAAKPFIDAGAEPSNENWRKQANDARLFYVEAHNAALEIYNDQLRPHHNSIYARIERFEDPYLTNISAANNRTIELRRNAIQADKELRRRILGGD